MEGFGCFVCVAQSTVGVMEKWGKFAGLHCLNPLTGEWLAGRLTLRVQSLDVRCDTKTKDNVFVSLICSIQYRVVRQNADDAFYELQNPKEQIQSYVFDVVRACVPRNNLDDVFEQKNEIARAVSEELEKIMGAYGYSIEQTLIVDIIPNPMVRRAMNEINAAQRMRVAALGKAEAKKTLQVKRAEGDAEAKYLHGHEIAAGHHGGAARERALVLPPRARHHVQGRHGPGDGHALLRHHEGGRGGVEEHHRVSSARTRACGRCHPSDP